MCIQRVALGVNPAAGTMRCFCMKHRLRVTLWPDNMGGRKERRQLWKRKHKTIHF